jgi:putative lipoic acid-binding regulatory protein
MHKPTVTYPCIWSFTIIGTNVEAVCENVAACLKSNAYHLTPSNRSRTGKYVSLHLETEVASEDGRNRLFARLQKAPSIKMIP